MRKEKHEENKYFDQKSNADFSASKYSRIILIAMMDKRMISYNSNLNMKDATHQGRLYKL